MAEKLHAPHEFGRISTTSVILSVRPGRSSAEPGLIASSDTSLPDCTDVPLVFLAHPARQTSNDLRLCENWDEYCRIGNSAH